MMLHPKIRALSAARAAHGCKGIFPLFEPYIPGSPSITPSLPETDLPMEIPADAHHVGPIVLPTQSVDTQDPELLMWLKGGPTVLMSLGTHYQATSGQGREQALAIRLLLEARPDVQILWKMKPLAGSTATAEVEELLSAELKSRKVRIESWLNSDPVSIMDSGHIVVTVSHGGANSWYEGLW
jgi:hypothetical protein